jgi:hypothetical protein
MPSVSIRGGRDGTSILNEYGTGGWCVIFSPFPSFFAQPSKRRKRPFFVKMGKNLCYFPGAVILIKANEIRDPFWRKPNRFFPKGVHNENSHLFTDIHRGPAESLHANKHNERLRQTEGIGTFERMKL